MPCPPDSEFKAFAADLLPTAREQQISEHLEVCPACRQRSQTLCGGVHLDAAKQTFGALGTRLDDATYDEPVDLRSDLYRLHTGDDLPESAATQPPGDLLRLLTAEPTDDLAGAQLGRFAIRRWLGAGAFGVVFLAYDELLRRDVALKLPRVHCLTRRLVRERFLREAEAAAQLHHPNVVPVFEAGEEQGVCYIASAYCPGPTLDVWLAEQAQPVPLAVAVTLCRQLAEAVQHAHQHRVLHRDIKPSNILLEPSQTDAVAPIPKITDFGLAKLLDTEVSMTSSQGLLGTPRYMAPEQAAGNRGAIGPATDVFALGAVLYELLTGVAPYAAEDQARTLHRLLYEPLVPPRRLRSDVPRDLEAICLKCLEKRPADRYAAAQSLADDLRRFEEGRATLARPVGRLELLRRWTIRQPAIAALLAVATLSLLGALGVFIAHSRSLESSHRSVQAALGEANAAQKALEDQRERMREMLYAAKITLAHQALQENDLRQASHLLEEIRTENSESPRGFVWHYLWNQVAARGQLIDDGDADVYALRFAPSGKRLAASGADSVLRIYDGHSFAPLISWRTEQGEVNSIDFSPDERTVATAGDDGTVRLWDAATGQPQRTIQAHPQLAFGVLFTRDGLGLISCAKEPVIRHWDLSSGSLRQALEGHTRSVEAITLSPDGSQLASASSDHTARVWDLRTGQAQHVLEGHANRVVDVHFSSDGVELLTGSIDRTIRLWRTTDGRCLQIQNHVDPVVSVTLLEGSEQLLAADRGGSVHVWQRKLSPAAVTSQPWPLHRWKAHQGRAWEVIATPERPGVLTAGADGKIYYWQRPPTAESTLTIAPGHTIDDMILEDGSMRLHVIDAAPDGETTVQTWDVTSGQRSTLGEQVAANGDATTTDPEPIPDLTPPDSGRLEALCMLPGAVLVTGRADGSIEGFDLPARNRRFQLQVPWQTEDASQLDQLAASDDGSRLAVFSYPNDKSAVFDLAQNRLLGTFEAYSKTMALSADGRRLAMSDGDDVVVWDVDQRRQLARLQGHTSSISALRFHPHGHLLASASHDRHVRLWDLSGRSVAPVTLGGHRAEVQAVAFSPDGRLLASGDARGELIFWFLARATELISIKDARPIQRLLFSSAGDRLVVQSDQQIRILSARLDGYGGGDAAADR